MKKAFIDAGHGGNDSGATGSNLREKDITLSVAKKVELGLKQQGVGVDMSRSNDSTLSLNARTSKANKLNSDCLVSIHVNDAENKSAQGIETYCYKFKYRKLADDVHSELLATGAYTKNRGVKEGNLHMVRESSMAACLIELGFIGNTEDANILRTKEDILSKAIVKGICKYLGVKYKEESKPIPPNNNGQKLAVCIGAFEVREYAEAALKEAKEKGFKDAYLIPR